MKLSVYIALILFTLNAYAADSIFGKWKDKSSPSSYKYEFKSNQDFIYSHYWKSQGNPKSSIKKGVWDIGDWSVTKPSGSKSSCNLTIYAGTNECCFDFKFIANNLILTNKYKTESYGSMCENRVLIKDK